MWLVVGFLTSAITLHIATLVLLEDAALVKAIAVAALLWLTPTVFVLFHLGSGLLYTIAAPVIGCALIKRLYGVGFGQALAVLLAHGVVEMTIGLVLWFMFPTLVGATTKRPMRRAPDQVARLPAPRYDLQ